MSRVTDILNEVGRQMRPLKRQAEAAKRHREVRDEVHALTLFLGGEDLRRLDRSLGEGHSRRAELEAANSQRVIDLASAETGAQALAESIAATADELDRDSTAAARLETTLERLRRVAQVAQERLRNGIARREGVIERRRDLELEMEALVAELAEVAVTERDSRQGTEQLAARLAMIEDQERSLADQAGLSAEGALAVVQGDHRSLSAADDRDRRELEAIGARESLLRSQLEGEQQSSEKHSAEIKRLDAEVGGASETYEERAGARRDEQAGWERATEERQERRSQVAASEARVEALGVAWVRTGDRASRTLALDAQGALGEITDLLKIPAEWIAATEAALGAFAGGVGFGSVADLSEAVSALKASGGGGVPLVSIAPAGTAPARVIAEENGLDALIDLIQGDRLTALLGDVVVVEGWGTAWSLVQRHPEIRAVTPEGDLITRHGVRVAQPEGETIPAAEALLENAKRELSRADSRLTTLHRQFEQARQREREALERLEALELRLAAETELLGRSRRNSSEISAELNRLDGRRQLLAAAIDERQSALGQLAETISNLEGEESQRQEVLAELADRRRLLASDREVIRDKWQEAAREAAQASERQSMLEARRQMIGASLGANPVDSPAPMVSEDDLARIEKVERLARRAIEVIIDRVSELRSRQSGYRHQLEISRPALDQALSGVSRLRLESERDTAELGSIALRLVESRVRREGVVESLLREIDADEETALATPRPPIEGDLAERLASRAAELRRMGPVNPMAAEEYATLAERHEFMSAQLDDLDRSAKELQKVMRALDDEIESRFVSAFTEVAAAYQEYFSVLFPGGHGRMRLIDPSTPLTSGVEIEAQPQGKKVSRLSLLSGGERSLAALAFLFAVFKARPSPFYILDEVEAALDDANLRRFLRLVEVFRGESQVILISHQQHTMEVADILYGVTLEPAGSSQVLSRALQSSTLGS